MSRPSPYAFKQALRDALAGLYDPGALASNPLVNWLGMAGDADPPRALLNLLLQAIESRKPHGEAPPQSNAWRVYHILRQRYVECYPQAEIAAGLGLGTRQLRRLHALAIDVLGDYLYGRCQQAGPAAPPLAPATSAPDHRELEALGATPVEAADPAALLLAVADLLEPVAHQNGVIVQRRLPEGLPLVAIQRVPVRHAFLGIVTAALRGAAGGSVILTGDAAAGHVSLSVEVQPAPSATALVHLDGEQTAMARQLLRLSGGDVTLSSPAHGQTTVTIMLPMVADVPVAIVDDNEDALQLFQRYLDGTRYRFVGTSDARQVLPLVEESAARLVVLDLMLPRVDGWELLSRLREHPNTRHIPVIICTVLPEEDLALLFGAAGLLRKPVTQADLLAALDRALTQPTGCA